MKRIITISFCIALLALKGADELFYIPDGWTDPVYNFENNPLTEEGVELGKALFYDPILSRDYTISCASCHSQYSAFTHVDHDLSHGIEDRIGKRNSPTLMNLAWHDSFMWDGAIGHLDVQSLAPISHHDEMDNSIDTVVHRLNNSDLYPKLYFDAFGDSLVTGEHTLKAIAQFMLTLISANSKYDQYKKGSVEFSEKELNGYRLFKENCNSCHTEPLFTNGSFENNGLSIDTSLNDYGRVEISLNPLDSLKFKVPTLRNIEFSYPYMHDGRYKRLREVIDHYVGPKFESNSLSSTLKKEIELTANQKVDLIAFLLTLTDKEFIFNKEFSFPRELLLNKK